MLKIFHCLNIAKNIVNIVKIGIAKYPLIVDKNVSILLGIILKTRKVKLKVENYENVRKKEEARRKLSQRLTILRHVKFLIPGKRGHKQEIWW